MYIASMDIETVFDVEIDKKGDVEKLPITEGGKEGKKERARRVPGMQQTSGSII